MAEALASPPATRASSPSKAARRELAGDPAGAIEAYEKAAAALAPGPRVAVERGAPPGRAGEAARRGAIRRPRGRARSRRPPTCSCSFAWPSSCAPRADTARAVAASDRLAALVAGDAKLDQALAEGRQALVGRRRARGLAQVPHRREHPAHDAALPAGPPRRRARRRRPAARGLERRRSRPLLRARAGDARSRSSFVPQAGRGASAGLPGAAAVRVGGQGRPRPRRRGDRGPAGRPRLRRPATGSAPPIPGSAAADVAVADVTNSGALDLVTPGALWIRDGEGYRRVAIAAGERVVPVRRGRRRRPRPVRLVEVRRPPAAQQPGRHVDRHHGGGGHRRRARPRGSPWPRTSTATATWTCCSRGPRAGSCSTTTCAAGASPCARRAFRRPAPSSAAAAGDLNGDGRDRSRLDDRGGRLRGPESRRRDVPARRGPLGAGAVPLLFDYDNDGFLDLFLGEPAGPSALYRNDGTGGLRRGERRRRCRPARDAEAVDFDGDGDLDLALVTPRRRGGALREPRRQRERLDRRRARGAADRLGQGQPLRLRLRDRGAGAGPLRLPRRVAAGHAPRPRRRGAGPTCCASSGPTACRRTRSIRRSRRSCAKSSSSRARVPSSTPSTARAGIS